MDELAGRYRLLERLDDDGVVSTWRAQDLRLRRELIVRRLSPAVTDPRRRASAMAVMTAVAGLVDADEESGWVAFAPPPTGGPALPPSPGVRPAPAPDPAGDEDDKPDEDASRHRRLLGCLAGVGGGLVVVLVAVIGIMLLLGGHGPDPLPSPDPSVPPSPSAWPSPSEPSLIDVPEVHGYPIDEARALVEDVGLQLVVSDWKRSDAAEPDTVIDQDPAPYTRVEPGSVVSVTAATDDGLVTVPDLVGLGPKRARQLLDRAGLELGERTDRASRAMKAGLVLDTDPRAGTRVGPGTAIDILVSTGPAATPQPTEPPPATPRPTRRPHPTAAPTPRPERTPRPTPERSPRPTEAATPVPSGDSSPVPSGSPEASASPSVSPLPSPSVSPSPSLPAVAWLLPKGGRRGGPNDPRLVGDAFAASCPTATLQLPDNAPDGATQLAEAQAAIAAGATVLVLDPVDVATARDVVQAARDAGVGIIVYDRIALAPVRPDAFVGYAPADVGSAVASVLASRIGTLEAPRLVIIGADAGDPTGNAVLAGLDGPLAAWAGDAVRVAAGSDEEVAAAIAEALASDVPPDGIAASTDAGARAAASALAGTGVTVPLVGPDATVPSVGRLIAGTQTAVGYRPAPPLAAAAADLACAMVAGTDPADLAGGVTFSAGAKSAPAILPAPVAVTADGAEGTASIADTIMADAAFGGATVDVLCTDELLEACTALGLVP